MSDSGYGIKKGPPGQPLYDPAEIIRRALTEPGFQLRIVLPPVTPCPFLDKLNGTIAIEYFYADGSSVPNASFVLETAVDSPVMAGSLANVGRASVTVPREDSYQVYLHHDRAPDGSVFQFLEKYKKDSTPFQKPSDWNPELLAQGKAHKLRVHWSRSDFEAAEFPKLRVEHMLLHVVSAVASEPEYKALHREAAQILMAMLLGQVGEHNLWRRLVVNRTVFSAGPQSLLCQELLCVNPGASATDLVCLLNSAGKGNAVDFFRIFADRLPSAGNAVAKHIDELIEAVASQLTALKNADQAGTHNQRLAATLLEGLVAIPSPKQHTDRIFGEAADMLRNLFRERAAFRIRKYAPVDDVTVFRQVAHPFPVYAPGPVTLRRTWFEACYRYTDKTPVTKARLVVQNASNHAPVAERDLDENGMAYVEVPADEEFEFRFDADEPVWTATSPEREAGLDPADANDWISSLIASDALATGQKSFKWQSSTEVTSFEDFSGAPSFSRLLRLSFIATSLPRRKGALKEEDKAGEAACTAIIRGLLYADKEEESKKAEWWREASFHRLRSVGSDDGAFVERLLALLNDREDLTLEQLFEWMNAVGKGNAKSWLKTLHSKLGDYRAQAAKGIQDALDWFAAQLQNIAEPGEGVKAKVSFHNSFAATLVRERVIALPKAAAALERSWDTAEARLKKILDTKSDAPLQKAALETVNEVEQKASPAPSRSGPALPEPAWIEVLYLYADGTPVKGSKYALPGNIDGTLDPRGLGFQIVPREMAGDYAFSDDPNEFTFKDSAKLKPKGPDVGAGMIAAAVSAGKFKAGVGVVRWDAVHFTANDAFQNAPSLSQIVSAVVQNHTGHVPSANSHEEMTLFLYPLIMAELLPEVDQKAIWKHVSFHRLGCCLGESSAVIRDLLHWLSATDGATVEDAIERLNSVGTGNAYKHLGKLHSEMAAHCVAVAANITAMLEAFRARLGELTGASDDDVAPAAKRFLRRVEQRIDKVKPGVQAKVDEALKPAIDKLNAIRQQPEPVAKGPAQLFCLNIHQQKKVDLQPRPVATPPAVDWLDLEYQHHDGAFVEEAEYVITNEAGDTVLLEGKLDAGFAHVVVPKDLNFKYYFRRDKAFTVDAGQKAKAIATFATKHMAAMVRNTVLLKKLKKTPLGWGAGALSDLKSFRTNPGVGAVATNIVREATISPHLFAEADSDEMAKLLHPLLMRQASNSALGPGNFKGNDELWIHAALNRLSALLGEDGPAVSGLLWAIHHGTKYQAGGVSIDAASSIRKAAALECLNSLGRGNAIRWIETLDPLKDANKLLVVGSIESILDKLKAEMDVLRLRPVSGATATPIERKLQSTMTDNYAAMIKTRVNAVRSDVGNRIAAAFTKLKAELKAVMDQDREKLAGKLNDVNLLKQASAPIPPRVALIPPWVELQYCYEDGEPVPGAKYELTKAGVQVHTGDLDPTTGFAYVTDVSACDEFFFKKESTVYQPKADVAAIPVRKRPEGRKTHTIPEPGYKSYAHPGPAIAAGNWSVNSQGVGNPAYAHSNVRNRIYKVFYPPQNLVFGWVDGTDGTAVPTLVGYQTYPSIRMLAAKAVHRNTPGCCGYEIYQHNPNTWRIRADASPERIEMLPLLERLVYNGGAAFGGGNVLGDLVVWSAIVMNRLGVTNGATCIAEQSRIRKAILAEVQRGASLQELIEKLNTAGKGHTVRWLRKLYTDRNDVKTAVVTSIQAIVTEIRDECNAAVTYQNNAGPPQFHGNLGPRVRPLMTSTRDNCNAVLAGTKIRDKINAVLDPVFATLNGLLANRPLNPRPYIRPAALSAGNVFYQPVLPFPMAQPQPTAPFWSLGAAPTTIQVKYKNPAGGDITADYHVSNASVPQLASVNGSRDFTIPAGAAGGDFYFDKDQGAVDFKPECKPFPNPELPATLTNNFLDSAANHNPAGGISSCFTGKDSLPWEGTVVVSPAAFQANPTVGQIIAKCVIDGMPLVSGAGDVQELTVALSRLISKPAARSDPDEWFRAAVAVCGAKPDHGSVIKGILLRVRKHRRMDPEEYFRLINFADANNGNAITWLKAQIIGPGVGDIGGAEAGLISILEAIHTQLGKFSGFGDAQVNANLKSFMANAQAAVLAVRMQVNAKVPACFTATCVPALNHMKGQLPLKRPACLGTNLYKREKAEMFLESQQSLSQADKQQVDNTARARIDSANSRAHASFANLAAGVLGHPYDQLFNNHKGAVPQTLHAYLNGTRGGQAKSLAPKLAAMSNDEFVDFVEGLGPPDWAKTTDSWGQAGGMGTMTSYQHTDGTLIRYKPHGDEYQRPPSPMYSIEVIKAGGGSHDAQFKIDPNGNAVPWGPGDAVSPYAAHPQKDKRYKDDLSKAGHRPLRY